MTLVKYAGNRINMKFCVNLGKTPEQTLKMLEPANSKSLVSSYLIFKRHMRINRGRVRINRLGPTAKTNGECDVTKHFLGQHRHGSMFYNKGYMRHYWQYIGPFITFKILQVYPFFQDKIADLCMQVLGQNYYLFSLYKRWRFQNRGDFSDWSVNEGGPIMEMSSAAENFEISMENVDDDSYVDTNLHLAPSSLSHPGSGKFLTPFQSGDILGCTVKRNLNQRPGTSTQTLYSAHMMPRPECLVENTSVLESQNRMEFNIAGHKKARNVIRVEPVVGAGNSRKLLITQHKKGRVQCATVTSSEVKNRLKTAVLNTKNTTTVSGEKNQNSELTKSGRKKRQKRDPSVAPRPLHPNSLKNLIQNRGKQVPELLAAQKFAQKQAAKLKKKNKPIGSKKLVHIRPKPSLQIVGAPVNTQIVATKLTRQKQASSKKQINKIKNKVKKKSSKPVKKSTESPSVKKHMTDPQSAKNPTADPQSPRKPMTDPQSPRKQVTYVTYSQSPRKQTTDLQSLKKETVPTDSLSVKKPLGYKQLAALQRHAGDVHNVGSTERGAKVKAQKKLNVYNEMMDQSTEADLSS